jgi:hypothetical protein
MDPDFTVQAVSGYAGMMWDEYEQSWDALDPGRQTSSHGLGLPSLFFK